LRLPSKTANLK